jgi:SAM-dependent methyltransferase
MREIEPSSFRDPSGFVFHYDGVIYRQVNQCYRENYEILMASGLYAKLIKSGLLVAHEVVDCPEVDAAASLTLRPERIPFISYPYEWSFGQLKAAALCTLRIHLLALQHGMILKDASAFNVQFMGSRPVLIDTLSFDRYQEGTPWIAYRQFCQHFLAPLFLMALRDPRLSLLSREWIDGIPLGLALRLSPWKARFRPGFFAHLYLHARAQEHYKDRPQDYAKKRGLSRASHLAILESLRATVERLRWDPESTVWAGYSRAHNYSNDAIEAKKRFVSEVVNSARPTRVVDLGANTGEYSRIAAAAGAFVVAADVDQGAVEICFRNARRERSQNLLPLVLDITNPTPAVGWMNRERRAFIDRCSENTDLVLALALLHHLALGNNVPLSTAVDFLASIGREAVVEFVGKDDSQVRRLLQTRKDTFMDYSEQGFEYALDRRFAVVRRERIGGTYRSLYHVRRKA